MKKGLYLLIGLIVGSTGGVLGSRLYFDRKYKAIADNEILDYKDKKNKEHMKQSIAAPKVSISILV